MLAGRVQVTSVSIFVSELKEQAATYRQRLRLLTEQEVAAFNSMLRQKNVPNLITEMP
jgi:hypothetical protein